MSNENAKNTAVAEALMCYHAFIEAQKEILAFCMTATPGMKTEHPMIYLYPAMVDKAPYFLYKDGSIEANCVVIANDSNTVDPVYYQGRFVITDESSKWDFKGEGEPEHIAVDDLQDLINTTLSQHVHFYNQVPKDVLETMKQMAGDVLYIKRAVYGICNP